jgi:hypothetical protein
MVEVQNLPSSDPLFSVISDLFAVRNAIGRHLPAHGLNRIKVHDTQVRNKKS